LEYSHFKLEDTIFLEGKGISFMCCWTRTQAGSVSNKQQVNKYLVLFFGVVLAICSLSLSLSLSPFPAEMVIGCHFEGPRIVFVCAVDLCLLLLLLDL
jgi:hypothetical protein